ncbi:MAG: YebC/PmpR family DNA-binding transcriptional regulator, partial [Pseudopedobacter saltans]
EGKKVLELRTAFADFGNMQAALEERKIVPISSEVEWIPTVTVPVTDEQAEEISKLIDIIEQDDDVNKVFHNMG